MQMKKNCTAIIQSLGTSKHGWGGDFISNEHLASAAA
jgi:hypothetical protein